MRVGRPELPWMRLLAGSGAVACALAVALGAYASHAVSGQPQVWLQTASHYLLVHGLAVLVLAPQAQRRLARLGVSLMLAGLALFAGALMCAALLGWSTRFAPAGGSALILAWLILAADQLRGSRARS